VSGALPLGGGPLAPSGGGGGQVDEICGVASAWCCRLPLRFSVAPPLNKPKVSPSLDPDLRGLAAPSSVLLRKLSCSAAPLPAGHGGEGWGFSSSRSPPGGVLVDGAEGAPSLRVSVELASRATGSCASVPAGRILL
jgi:hypothetical protein